MECWPSIRAARMLRLALLSLTRLIGGGVHEGEDESLGRVVRHGGRRARVRGHTKVDADFTLLAAAVNLARLATLGITHHTSGWTVTTT